MASDRTNSKRRKCVRAQENGSFQKKAAFFFRLRLKFIISSKPQNDQNIIDHSLIMCALCLVHLFCCLLSPSVRSVQHNEIQSDFFLSVCGYCSSLLIDCIFRFRQIEHVIDLTQNEKKECHIVTKKNAFVKWPGFLGSGKTTMEVFVRFCFTA